MADGVLTSSLERTLCILFFGVQALPKNRGHVLTPGFGKIQSERVFSMRKFHIVEWNNFDVWLSPFDLISVAEAVLRVTKFNILSAFRPITSSI